MKIAAIKCLAVLISAHLVLGQRPACNSVPPQRNSELADRSNHLFMGLTAEETQQVIEYLMSQSELNLKHGINASADSNYIYSIENFVPLKSHAIKWLDGKISQCMRLAQVILFMGESQKVLELVVGPIPRPSYHAEIRLNRKAGSEISWASRPLGFVEGVGLRPYFDRMLKSLNPFLDNMVSNYCDSYLDCATVQYIPRSSMDSVNRHFIVYFTMSAFRFEAYYLLPLPLHAVMSYIDNEKDLVLRELFYRGESYTLDGLLKEYEKDSKQFVVPGWNEDLAMFGSPHAIDEDETTDDVRRPPTQFYPDGQRFRVDGHHVEWLKWSFNLHTRTIAGLQLFDVRHDGERIAYEISIQDIAVVYSGEKPDGYFKTVLDNGFGVGRMASTLIRGVDCPEGSVYLNATAYATEFDENMVTTDAICIFEHRNSVPIRRHYSGDGTGSHRFAFSMPDSVLIVRQILTVTNYDYIYDFEIHQNGVIEAKISSTGYIQMATNIIAGEQKYGLLLNPSWGGIGVLHQHLFNFKFDVDIEGGTCNRFKTINFGYERSDSKYSNGEPWYVAVVNETVVENEEAAKIKLDFNKPKQYIIYKGCDQSTETRYGYRIHSNGFTKSLLPEDSPLNKGALSWANYQLAVTKYNDAERSTSSYFGQGNPMAPDVNFETFFENNDSILDTDLVAWVTVGLNHLPTNEDIPVTTTSGKTLSASLYPFNYFKRDLSIYSRDGTLFYNQFDEENEYLHYNDTCEATASEPTLYTPPRPAYLENGTDIYDYERPHGNITADFDFEDN